VFALLFLKASLLMPGVDFVISALFETSGLRWGGVCARTTSGATASSAQTSDDKFIGRMA